MAASIRTIARRYHRHGIIQNLQADRASQNVFESLFDIIATIRWSALHSLDKAMHDYRYTVHLLINHSHTFLKTLQALAIIMVLTSHRVK